ncbi:hypothetical protein V6N12_047615 [Hibiscus sabdariffa]|uniref:BHLH domain-containing protein n=1 Tax=Hibiscus sabdariffa TaxID=183260 RepID=A0ABR2CTY0_9ROSI
MRLLQGLVPGCSKVKGKEAMLDEIINYVQSFQRLVEVVKERVAARIAENEYLKEENDRLNTDITMLEEAKEQIGLLPFSGEQFEHQRHIDHHVSISEAVDKITIELILKLLSSSSAFSSDFSRGPRKNQWHFYTPGKVQVRVAKTETFFTSKPVRELVWPFSGPVNPKQLTVKWGWGS